MDHKLTQEIQARQIIGTFEKPPLHNVKVSPLRVIPKTVQGEC